MEEQRILLQKIREGLSEQMIFEEKPGWWERGMLEEIQAEGISEGTANVTTLRQKQTRSVKEE